MQKFVWLIVLLAGLCGQAFGQHVHLSQLYATPLNLSPAFAGLQAKASASAQYRNQWPKLSNNFQTIQASGDYRFKESSNGIGLLLYQDQTGEGGISRSEASGNYAYHTELTSSLVLSGGIGVGVGIRKVDFGKLVFGDQISENGYLVSGTQEAQPDYAGKAYFSLNTGGVLASKNFWVSLGGFHLNRPSQSASTQGDPLQASYVVTSGYKFYLEETFANEDYQEISISPAVLYYRQGGLEQFNFGIYSTFSPLQAAVVMKGITLFGEKQYSQALALLLGANVGHFNACYSYDIPVSGIGRSAGGAHELSVVFQNIEYNKIYRKRVKHKKYRHVPCPVF